MRLTKQYRITVKFTPAHLLGVFIALLVICYYLSSGFFRTKGYSSTFDFVTTLAGNFIKGINAKPQTIKIIITPEDLRKIEQQRDEHLKRGLIITEGNTWVPATIRHNKKKLQAEIRLKGHMTDHLEGKKWSFRIKIKGGKQLWGMKWLSIQHPGTRNYFYEWIFHRLLKSEDIIALRYFFVQVAINGKNMGIYAVEEHFGEELAENNHRPAAPIFRFNPDLYWVDRYHEITGDKSVSEYSTFQSSVIEAYRSNKIFNDSVQKRYFLEGASLLEGFRRGELNAAQVFDIPRLAMFHAVIDLVGGHHSLDWSDVKYYYNPESKKIEPVGYESFSANRIDRLAGSYRYNGKPPAGNLTGIHQLIFNDTAFFRIYIASLEKISEYGYLDTFFTRSAGDLHKILDILYSEFPYKKFDKHIYYQNQQTIRKILSPPRAVNAYLKMHDSLSVTLQVGNIESLPVEITGLSSGDSLFAIPAVCRMSYGQHSCILPSKQSNEPVTYSEVTFVRILTGQTNSELSEAKFRLTRNGPTGIVKKSIIHYHILGASHSMQTDVFEYPFPGK